jgi:hypothetical protein
MKLLRWGANRNSGATTVFDKKASATWGAAKNVIVLTVPRVDKGEQGQYNFRIELTAQDIQGLIAALSSESALPAVAELLQPACRDLTRLHLAAAGFTPATD